MKNFREYRGAAAALILAIAITGTTALADEEKARGTSDPLETLNRFTSGFNTILRKGFIDPAVDLYQYVTPDPIENAISNAASNLSEPLTVGSSLLQGDTENAGKSTQRFLINTTVGIGGLGDPATDMGIEARREDLGQALGAHGVESGPHIVLPVLGPSNFRDLAGDLPVMILNPIPLAGTVAKGAVEYSGKQETVQSISKGAVDPYVAEREAYEQNRAYEVRNGALPAASLEDPLKLQ
ncbi:MAG: VacJ family lipoprotein [Rhodospirillaceae bacterium]|nr:VacJ family lipoprotein [Rhodospirillaceae bacterium]